jgi:cytochrome P450
MLDISIDDRDSLRQWANSLGTFVGADWRDEDVIAEAHESVFNLRSYLTGVFDERSNGPTTDLLAALIAAEGDGGDRFTEDELVAMITQFVFAGHETSTMFLGNALVALLGEYRDQWHILGEDDGSLIGPAVDELLRYESPTHNIDKLAGEPIQVGGVPIEQWDTINLMLASANRDPDTYAHPDRLDITRTGAPPHLSFGRGPHHCLGASLARLEAQVSLRMLARRFPQMRLATDTVLWRSTHMNRGPEVLPVILGPERIS